MAILDPIRVVILDYPQGQWEDIEVPYFPSHREANLNYRVPFGRVIYVDASDYLEVNR